MSNLQQSQTEVVIFTDLDDSLFQSRRKCTGDHLSVAAYDRQGAARSFHTPQQRALLNFWSDATLIPVTGRSSDALERVTSLTWSSYRIVSHGAEILSPSGASLSSWRDHVKEEVEQWRSRLLEAHSVALEFLAELREALSQEPLCSEELAKAVPRARLISEGDLLVYLSIKGPAEQLNALSKLLTPLWLGGVIHHNDRDMALLPSYANKARAVSHLLDILRSDLTNTPLVIGLGDSISDLSFLKLCDFALTPQHSQIQQERW